MPSLGFLKCQVKTYSFYHEFVPATNNDLISDLNPSHNLVRIPVQQTPKGIRAMLTKTKSMKGTPRGITFICHLMVMMSSLFII